MFVRFQESIREFACRQSWVIDFVGPIMEHEDDRFEYSKFEKQQYRYLERGRITFIAVDSIKRDKITDGTFE